MPDHQASNSSHISRRVVLGTAAAIVATPALAEGCVIGPPKHEKGPLVWMDMDQVELDAAYDQNVYAPMINQIQARYATSSITTRARLGAPKRFAYGPTAIEGLDLYPAKTANAPIFIFVHGGRWLRGAAKDYGFPADLFVNAGVNYIALDFIAVDAAKGDLRPMADQVRRAIAWVYKNAASFGGDTKRFYVGGHSYGGHLCGVALVTDWEKEFGLPADFITGAADERPLRHEGAAPFGAQQLREIRRRYGIHDEFAAAHRQTACADYGHLRHVRVAGVSAAEPRLRRGGEGCRQACRVDRSAQLQSFRNVRKPRQSVRPERPRGAQADEAGLVLRAYPRMRSWIDGCGWSAGLNSASSV